MSVMMQARSSTSGAIVTWLATSPDWTATSFPGPGVAQDVVVAAADDSHALVGARGGVKAPILGELQTAAAGVAATPIASYTMVDESLCAFDAYVTMARRTNVTKAGAYKRTVAYRRTSGAGPVVVGTPPPGIDEETTAGDDVTFTVVGNVVRVVVTAADVDPRNWTCELRVQETLAT